MAAPSNLGRVWRLAPVLATLRSEVDVRWPNRATTKDGAIGDLRHAARHSHHNPDEQGYVRAWDLTRDDHNGPDLERLADFLRRVGASGSQRLSLGGYIIYDRKIASERSEWTWITYKGADPHTGHLHLSCSQLPAFYKITRPWQVADALDRARW